MAVRQRCTLPQSRLAESREFVRRCVAPCLAAECLRVYSGGNPCCDRDGANNPKSRWPEKHLQRVKYRLQMELALINRRRRGAALEQSTDCLPRRAHRAFDGEGYLFRHIDVLADKSEIGRTLWNGRRHVAAAPGEPDVVDVGHVARHANR